MNTYLCQTQRLVRQLRDSPTARMSHFVGRCTAQIAVVVRRVDH